MKLIEWWSIDGICPVLRFHSKKLFLKGKYWTRTRLLWFITDLLFRGVRIHNKFVPEFHEHTFVELLTSFAFLSLCLLIFFRTNLTLVKIHFTLWTGEMHQLISRWSQYTKCQHNLSRLLAVSPWYQFYVPFKQVKELSWRLMFSTATSRP